MRSRPFPFQARPPLRGVCSLKLTAFRSYESKVLDLEPSSLVLIGPNGVGKTNLLEALSFLAPGRGLRRARLQDIQCDQDSTKIPWAVSACLESPEGVLDMGTGPEALHCERRVVRVNGVKLKTQADLSSYTQVTWLTPQMDRLFLEGPSGRRRFLDRLVFGFDPLHAKRVLRYEQTLRERHRLFEQHHTDPTWFKALEETLSQEAVAITTARQHVIRRLNEVLEQRVTSFPQGRLLLQGDLEAQLNQGFPPQVVEAQFAADLNENRFKDKAARTTLQGCHRSDLKFFHENGREASFCSTGEQKSLLISLILAASHLQAKRQESIPLLLLDEVVAHLDLQRRSALFEDLLNLKMQIWMTGTDASLFSDMTHKIQFFFLEEKNLSCKRSLGLLCKA